MSDRLPLVDVLVRQREAWQRGQRSLVEALLEAHPHLADERDSVLDLLYNEHLLREEFGPSVPVEEYFHRFPHLSDDLRIQFEVDQALTVEDMGPAVQLGATVFAGATDGVGERLPRLEGCDILGELGKGAMGIVYRGWQRGARRPVAIKVLSADVPAARIRTEAEAASRLIHPNIVQVFEVKQFGDRTALVLEFVEGGNLAQKLAGKPQLALDSARLVETLAWAMAYAHGRGVIHRDLKPSNILLSAKADASLNQIAPKISDFGLAKLLEGEAPGLTRTADILGTPSYMAPEQTGIASAPIGPPADVWSLGAILYECLTGRPPFLGQSVLDTIEQVRHTEPVPPSRLQPRIPHDLEIICLKCLEKIPARRYATARDLAEDLRRYQNHEPIQARAAGLAERGWKLARRRPVPATLLMICLIASAMLLVGGIVVNRALRNQRDLARRQADELDGQLGRTRQLLYTAQLLRVGSVWESDPLQGLGMLEDTHACPLDLRCLSWRVLHAQCRRYRESIPTPGGAITALAMSPSSGAIAWGGSGGQVYLKKDTAAPVPLVGHTSRVVALSFTRDGKLLASAGQDGRIVVWDMPAGTPRPRLAAPRGRIAGLAWLADGPVLVVNCGAPDGVGAISLIDIQAGRLQRTLETKTSPVSGVAVSPDGLTIACAGHNQAICLLDARTGQRRAVMRGHTAPVSCLVFASLGRPLVSGSLDGTVRIWDPVRETELGQFAVATGPVRALALDPSGQRLAVAGEGPPDGGSEVVPDVQLWDLVSRQGGAPLRGHPGGAVGVAFSHDGHTLATAGADGTVKVWDYPGRREQVTLRSHTGKPNSLALARDGRTLAWVTRGDRPGSRGQEINIYDLDKSASAGVIRAHGRPVQCLALHPQGQLIASAAGEPDEPAEVLVWEVRTGRLVQALRGHAPGVAGLVFSHEGRTLVSACRDGAVKAWDMTTGKLLWERSAGIPSLHAVALSGDGAWLAAGGGEPGGMGQVVVWKLADGTERGRYATAPGVTRLALATDGSLAAWAGRDGVVRLVEIDTGHEREPLAAGMKGIASLAFSPDGQTLAVAGTGTGVKLWDVATAQERASLPGHRGGACFVAFTGDGGLLVSASVSQVARLWYAGPPAGR